MHASVQDWVAKQTAGIEPGSVVELGSLDVNGGVRHLVPHADWLGIDLVAGPGVDMVCDAHDIPLASSSADLVLYLECAEHDAEPNATMATIARILKPNGTALITTRSEGFPYHHPPDYWRYTGDDLHALAYTAGLDVLCVEDDPEAPGVFAVLELAC